MRVSTHPLVLTLALSSLVSACAGRAATPTAAPTAPQGLNERVLGVEGQLAVDEMPTQPVVVGAEIIDAWGLAEADDAAAANAQALAQTRDTVRAFIESTLQSLDFAMQMAGQANASAEEVQRAESLVYQRVLAQLDAPASATQRLEREGQQVFRAFVRVRLSVSAVRAALADALGDRPRKHELSAQALAALQPNAPN